MRIEFKEKGNKIEKGFLLEVDAEVKGVVMNITQTSSGKYGRLFDVKSFGVIYFVIIMGEIMLFDTDPIFPKNHEDISQKLWSGEYGNLEEEYNLDLQSDDFYFIPISDYKLVIGE